MAAVWMRHLVGLGLRAGQPAAALVLGLMMTGVVGCALVEGTLTKESVETQSGPTGTVTQVHEGGQVTVAITPQSTAGGITFLVTLDSHSVDLDGIDLKALAVLRTADGREVQPEEWDAPKGGHHRKGTLRFPASPGMGAPSGTGVGAMTLVLRDIAGISERMFQWMP